MGGIAPSSGRTSQVAVHVAEADPHTQYQRESEKAQPSGYASLDSSGDVPVAQLRDFSAALATTIPIFTANVTAAVLAPTTGKGRCVVAVANLQPTGSNAAKMQMEVETGPGAGTYTAVSEISTEAAAGVSRRGQLSFIVPAGRNYRFVKGGLAGVIESIAIYSYTDL